VSPVELAAWLVLWGGLAVAAARWPGRALGVAVALVLWTGAPVWFWSALAVTAVAAIAWRVFGPAEHLGPAGGARWLAHRPGLATVALATGAVAFGGDIGALVGFALLIAVAGWLAWPRGASAGHRRRAPAGRAGQRLGPGPVGPQLGAGDVTVSRAGPCVRCGAPTVASVRAPMGPGSLPDLGGVIARAVCVECGARLVGVADPARPAVGLVWFEMPDSEVSG
jgi:hypothetical protein